MCTLLGPQGASLSAFPAAWTPRSRAPRCLRHTRAHAGGSRHRGRGPGAPRPCFLSTSRSLERATSPPASPDDDRVQVFADIVCVGVVLYMHTCVCTRVCERLYTHGCAPCLSDRESSQLHNEEVRPPHPRPRAQPCAFGGDRPEFGPPVCHHLTSCLGEVLLPRGLWYIHELSSCGAAQVGRWPLCLTEHKCTEDVGSPPLSAHSRVRHPHSLRCSSPAARSRARPRGHVLTGY